MEINKQTKIYYMHNLTDDAFLKNGGSIHISTLTSLKEYYFRRKKDINNLPPPGGQIVNSDIAHQLEEKYDRIDSNSLELVFGKVVVVEGYSKDPYYKTVLPLITWSSVADAKTKIFPESSIKTLNAHCEKQEWALVDSNTGLKHTYDFKIEYDPALIDHGTQLQSKINSEWKKENINKVTNTIDQNITYEYVTKNQFKDISVEKPTDEELKIKRYSGWLNVGATAFISQKHLY